MNSPEVLEEKEAGVDRPWLDVAVNLTAWACLALVLFWIVRRIWAALFIPWWFNTDEVVIYYEVVRQVRLDPSQTFFDIPGTPFMSLASILTSLWWAFERLFQMTASGSPSDFIFQNIQGVITLMRMLTLSLYIGAAGVAYDLFRRSAGALAGLVATLLFATLTIFVQYSYFVRTESLGLVFTLSAIWIVLYSRWCGKPRAYGIAGVLAGLAMAARYHFALVAFPVILLLFALHDRDRLEAPDASRYAWLYRVWGVIGSLFISGGALALAFRTHLIGPSGLTNMLMITSRDGMTQYPAARALVSNLWLLLGFGALLIMAAHRIPEWRRRIWPAVNPFTLLATLGFVAGFVISNPEILWRGEYQLKSIQFYSDWIDPDLSKLSPVQSWWKITSYYFTHAFPEPGTQALFFAGLVIIIWRRRPVHLALASGAVLCFLAHPLHMKMWPHHVIPWLPLLCFVASVPVGEAGSWLLKKTSQTRLAAAALVVAASGIVVMACGVRLQEADGYFLTSRARTDQIVEMNRWLSQNVPTDTYLLQGYYALSEDGLFDWMESSGVRVPRSARKYPNFHTWWLERSAVDGHAGIVSMSRADIAFFHDDFERKKPGSTYNPFENKNFTQLAHFGAGFYELSVFRFDCRSRSCVP